MVPGKYGVNTASLYMYIYGSGACRNNYPRMYYFNQYNRKKKSKKVLSQSVDQEKIII